MLELSRAPWARPGVTLCIDTMFDSPGYCASWGTVTIYCVELGSSLITCVQRTTYCTDCIVATLQLHRSETDWVSSRIEVEATERLIEYLLARGVVVRTICMDQNATLMCKLRLRWSHIKIALDCWHVGKSVTQNSERKQFIGKLAGAQGGLGSRQALHQQGGCGAQVDVDHHNVTVVDHPKG